MAKKKSTKSEAVESDIKDITPETAPEEMTDVAVTPDIPEQVEEAVEVAIQDDQQSDDTSGDDVNDDTTLEGDEGDPIAATPDPVVAPTTVVQRKGGTGAMLLGGVVAAGLGYGVSEYTRPEVDLTPLTQPIETRIDGLEAKLSALPTDEALARMQSAADAATTASATLKEELTSQFARFDERLTSVELRAESGQADMTTVTAYERELNELRDELLAAKNDAESRIASLEQNASQVATDSAALRADADAARQAARAAEARAALSQVNKALANGDPFAPALETLAAQVEVPEALRAVAETGITPLSDLRESLPEVARDALAAARSAGESGETSGGLGSLFRNQFNLRSTAPRAGDDADAILSRAEAALRSDDLTTTLTELSALPDAAQATLSGWIEAAQARADAVAASDAISQTLTQK